jgi:hypothetical protein
VVTHAKLGTLYEEPCLVYLKVREGEEDGGPLLLARCRGTFTPPPPRGAGGLPAPCD